MLSHMILPAAPLTHAIIIYFFMHLGIFFDVDL